MRYLRPSDARRGLTGRWKPVSPADTNVSECGRSQLAEAMDPPSADLVRGTGREGTPRCHPS